MFDFAWSEFALIGIVALIAIGPKDLPVAIKTVTDLIKKARRMAAEFQTHVDEMVRDADLGEVKSHFDDLRRMDLKSTILKAVDEDGSLRRTLAEPPVDLSPPPPPVPAEGVGPAVPAAVTAASLAVPAAALAPAPAGQVARPVPAFLPPAIAAAGPHPPAPPPAFVPPAYVAGAEAERRARRRFA